MSRLHVLVLVLALIPPCAFAGRGAGSGGVGGYGGMTPSERESRRPDRYGAMKPSAEREAEKKAEERDRRIEQQRASEAARPDPK